MKHDLLFMFKHKGSFFSEIKIKMSDIKHFEDITLPSLSLLSLSHRERKEHSLRPVDSVSSYPKPQAP